MTKLKVNAQETRGPIGLTHPSLEYPTLVPFGSLNVCFERFQVRSQDSGSYASLEPQKQESLQQSHEPEMLLTDGTTLDPIVVWKDATDKHWVIDGHDQMQTLTESRCPDDQPIWIQLFKGVQEADARDFALQIPRLSNINMDESEILENYWQMLLLGETVSSVRDRVSQYDISQSTIERMDNEKKAVIESLLNTAVDKWELMDATFIRTNSPLWKEVANWMDRQPVVEVSEIKRRTVEVILRKLRNYMADQAKTQPELVLEAFQEFFLEITGTAIAIQRLGHCGTEADLEVGF